MGNRPVNKNRKLGYGSYIGITIIILVSILRFDVGWDYPGYYETVYPSLDTYAIDRFEPFNKIICQLVSYTKWPPLLFIIYGLITYILVFSTLRKYTDNLFLATLTYLAFFYTTSLGPIRQGVALAIVLYAYRYLVTKAYLKYIGAVVIAGMFHYTAFVCILIPVIFYFMLIPFAYCFFQLCLIAKVNIDSKRTSYMRKCSIICYFSQFPIIFMCGVLTKYLPFGIDFANFVITIVAANILSYMIIRYSDCYAVLKNLY